MRAVPGLVGSGSLSTGADCRKWTGVRTGLFLKLRNRSKALPDPSLSTQQEQLPGFWGFFHSKADHKQTYTILGSTMGLSKFYFML